jgi:hypothetical protein
VTGEDLGDQPAPAIGQRDDDEPAIVVPARLLDEAAPHEVADDDGGVAVAAQQLDAEIALAQRAVVQQRLQDAELPDRETHRRHHSAHAGGDGLGRPHELDVGVERDRFRRGARVARRHGSNLNGLYAGRAPLSSRVRRREMGEGDRPTGHRRARLGARRWGGGG